MLSVSLIQKVSPFQNNDTVEGMRGSAAFGIVVDAGGQDRVSGCNVTATGTGNGTAAYLVGAGGGLHEHGAVFRCVRDSSLSDDCS